MSAVRLIREGTARGRRDGAGNGWSLIELLVVVVVLAILALAATPGFRSSMLRAQRTEATAALLALAAAQERFHLQHHVYATDLAAAPPDGLGLDAVTESGRYLLTITAADAAGFTATATARGRQARDTRCAEFGIDATGARTATAEDCWSR
jgi:type IV pilus assembly protein PilE